MLQVYTCAVLDGGLPIYVAKWHQSLDEYGLGLINQAVDEPAAQM